VAPGGIRALDSARYRTVGRRHRHGGGERGNDGSDRVSGRRCTRGTPHRSLGPLARLLRGWFTVIPLPSAGIGHWVCVDQPATPGGSPPTPRCAPGINSALRRPRRLVPVPISRGDTAKISAVLCPDDPRTVTPKPQRSPADKAISSLGVAALTAQTRKAPGSGSAPDPVNAAGARRGRRCSRARQLFMVCREMRLAVNRGLLSTPLG
jgi:hypothetical protein